MYKFTWPYITLMGGPSSDSPAVCFRKCELCVTFVFSGTSWTSLQGCAWTASTLLSTRSQASWTWISFSAACPMRTCPTTCGRPSAVSCSTCMWTETPRSRSPPWNTPASGQRSPLRSPLMSEPGSFTLLRPRVALKCLSCSVLCIRRQKTYGQVKSSSIREERLSFFFFFNENVIKGNKCYLFPQEGKRWYDCPFIPCLSILFSKYLSVSCLPGLKNLSGNKQGNYVGLPSWFGS